MRTTPNTTGNLEKQKLKTEASEFSFMTVSIPIIRLTHWVYHGNGTLSVK